MQVGIPKEIKVHESRVAITPDGVSELVRAGHEVFIEAGAVPVASTYALTNATMPYTLALANFGWESAITKDLALAKGLNISGGKVRYQAVAQAHAYEFSPIG